MLKRKKEYNIKVTNKNSRDLSIVLKNTLLQLYRRKTASVAKALRFERSLDPEEPATRKAYPRSLPFSFSLALFLVFFSLRALYVSSSSSSFFSTSLLPDLTEVELQLLVVLAVLTRALF